MPERLQHRSREPANTIALEHSWASRVVLLLAMLILPMLGTLLYASPAWAAILVRIWNSKSVASTPVADGAMTAVWLVGALGLGLFVLRATRLSESGTPIVLCCVTAEAMGLGIISLLTLGLGMAGALHAFSAWMIVIVGITLGSISIALQNNLVLSRVGVLAHPSKTASRAVVITDFAKVWAWVAKPAGWHWLWLLATPFLTLALTAAMAPPGMLWTPEEPHGYDVVEYHLQIPREWYEAGRIIPLHHNVFSYFPFNVEMHYLLAMNLRGGPWAAMYETQLMHLSFIALSVLAVYGFARRHTKPAIAIVAALSLLTVPWLTQLAGIAYDEGGLLLFGTLAIGWAMTATFEPAHRLRRFILAGTMAGFAAGSKLTAVPEVLVAIPVICSLAAVWMFFHRDAAGCRAMLLGIALFCLAGLLCFSPWLVRNIAWAHNPVFPEMMPLLGQNHFTPTQVERFELAHKPPPELQPLGARLDRFGREILLSWQFGYLLLPMGVIAGIASVLLANRRGQALFLLGLLILIALFWLGLTHLQGRFLILATPIAAMLLAQFECMVGSQSVGQRGFEVLGQAHSPEMESANRNLHWRLAAIGAAVLVVIFAAIAWTNINDKLSSHLYGSSPNNAGIVSVLGMDGTWLYTQMLPPELPKDSTIVLIGDARPFLYPIPMTRLRYRTVFDVGDGPDIVTAWEGFEPPKPGEWLVIDPAELNRFRRTYFGLPQVPPGIEHASAPFTRKR